MQEGNVLLWSMAEKNYHTHVPQTIQSSAFANEKCAPAWFALSACCALESTPRRHSRVPCHSESSCTSMDQIACPATVRGKKNRLKNPQPRAVSAHGRFARSLK